MPSIQKTIWTQRKNVISFPHDEAAENRSKSIRQKSLVGTNNREDFHIQRPGEKSRWLADQHKKDADDFLVLILTTALQLLAPHSVAYQVLSYFVPHCRKSTNWRPICKVLHTHPASFTRNSLKYLIQFSPWTHIRSFLQVFLTCKAVLGADMQNESSQNVSFH